MFFEGKRAGYFDSFSGLGTFAGEYFFKKIKFSMKIPLKIPAAANVLCKEKME